MHYGGTFLVFLQFKCFPDDLRLKSLKGELQHTCQRSVVNLKEMTDIQAREYRSV